MFLLFKGKIDPNDPKIPSKFDCLVYKNFSHNLEYFFPFGRRVYFFGKGNETFLEKVVKKKKPYAPWRDNLVCLNTYMSREKNILDCIRGDNFNLFDFLEDRGAIARTDFIEVPIKHPKEDRIDFIGYVEESDNAFFMAINKNDASLRTLVSEFDRFNRENPSANASDTFSFLSIFRNVDGYAFRSNYENGGQTEKYFISITDKEVKIGLFIPESYDESFITDFNVVKNNLYNLLLEREAIEKIRSGNNHFEVDLDSSFNPFSNYEQMEYEEKTFVYNKKNGIKVLSYIVQNYLKFAILDFDRLFETYQREKNKELDEFNGFVNEYLDKRYGNTLIDKIPYCLIENIKNSISKRII